MDIVTQKTIAKRLGVHSTTVSMALRGAKSIPESTRRRIIEAAREMGYQPNAMARRLRYQKSQMIGVISGSNIQEMYFRRISLVSQVAQERGYDCILFTPRLEDSSYETAINSLASHQVTGIIASTPRLTELPKAYDAWRRQDWPTVNLAIIKPMSVENLIDTDRRQGYRQALTYLVSLGHRDIAIAVMGVTGVVDLRMTTRLQGYRDGLEIAQIPYRAELVFQANIEDELQVARLARRLMEMKPRPTALLAYSDVEALWFIRHLLKLGLKVPQDISVIGFDDASAAQASILPLTTLAQPVDEIARKAVEQVLAMADGKQPRQFEPILFPPKLIVRETTAPPGSNA